MKEKGFALPLVLAVLALVFLFSVAGLFLLQGTNPFKSKVPLSKESQTYSNVRYGYSLLYPQEAQARFYPEKNEYENETGDPSRAITVAFYTAPIYGPNYQYCEINVLGQHPIMKTKLRTFIHNGDSWDEYYLIDTTAGVGILAEHSVERILDRNGRRFKFSSKTTKQRDKQHFTPMCETIFSTFKFSN